MKFVSRPNEFFWSKISFSRSLIIYSDGIFYGVQTEV